MIQMELLIVHLSILIINKSYYVTRRLMFLFTSLYTIKGILRQ